MMMMMYEMVHRLTCDTHHRMGVDHVRDDGPNDGPSVDDRRDHDDQRVMFHVHVVEEGSMNVNANVKVKMKMRVSEVMIWRT
jgi:hypothetical protein